MTNVSNEERRNDYIVVGAGAAGPVLAAELSASGAFLRPALSRPNLTLLLNTNVVKLNFKGTITGGASKDIAADKEVILAAGAIHSPKLLMLSGVGEAKALRSLGIDLVENLPGVGQNLQDHVLLSGVVFKYKGKMPDRPADSNAVEAEAYLSSNPSGDTDISLVPHQLPVVTPEVATRFGTPPPDTFTILWAAVVLCKWGLGSVRLKREKRRLSKMTIVHPLGNLRPPQNFNAAEANIVDRSRGERKKKSIG